MPSIFVKVLTKEEFELLHGLGTCNSQLYVASVLRTFGERKIWPGWWGNVTYTGVFLEDNFFAVVSEVPDVGFVEWEVISDRPN